MTVKVIVTGGIGPPGADGAPSVFHTAALWASTYASVVLAAGTLGVESDTSPQKFKIGDGTTAYSVLPYAGSAGGGGTAQFSWAQNSPSTTWPILHNLGFYPAAITVIDNSGNVLVLFDRTDPDTNHTTLTFAAAVAGVAYLI